ncbi:nitrate- and nitrite sensing domain-containing protein, partial [bacterium]|nr:nitrate- and nitrite sensing domain-containing protein [bacterium]
MKNIKILHKIIIIALIPMITTIFLTYKNVVDMLKEKTILQQMSLNVDLSEKTSILIGELQKERGKTAVYLSGGGDLSEVGVARENSNSKIDDWKKSLENSSISKKEYFLNELERLTTIRDKYKIKNISLREKAINDYATIINSLITLQKDISNAKTTRGYGKKLTTNLLLLITKEQTGLLRANLTSIIVRNEAITMQEIELLLTLKSNINSYINSPTLILHKDELELLNKIPKTDSWIKVNQYLSMVILKANQGNFEISYNDFWGNITKVIDDISKVIEKNNHRMVIDLKKDINTLSNDIISFILIILPIILLIIILIYFVSKGINKSIKNTTSMINDAIKNIVDGVLDKRLNENKTIMEFYSIIESINLLIDTFVKPINVTAEYIERISRGDIPQKITDDYKGDFNEIKNNLNSLIDANKIIINIAQKISDGDFSINIQERSREDKLLISLKKSVETIKSVENSINQTIMEIQKGNLSFRTESSMFLGGWKNLLTSLNSLTETFVKPIDLTFDYLSKISIGNIPEPIKEDCKGDFNQIKNSINALIEILNNLIKEMNHMSDEHDKGDIDILIDSQKFQNAYKVMADGINNMVLGHISVKKKAM